MEKAILKTLIYSDIFDYPLKAWEVHKWLIGRRASLKQIEKALKRLNKELSIKNKGDYYFLPRRSGLVKKRVEREEESRRFFRQARFYGGILRAIPWIKLVGVSGSLAMDNAKRGDDIDFFIVTEKGRLWISRLFIILMLEFFGVRRKRGEDGVEARGKICVNILLEEGNLAQPINNIYLAHEVLQMRVLWQRGGAYQRFLEENDWVFRYLPNWVSGANISHQALGIKRKNQDKRRLNAYILIPDTLNWLEGWAGWFQKRYMGKPSGKERIYSGALYFHPGDVKEKVLAIYQKRIKRI